MNQEIKSNNTASVVVAILAVGLIVGAVFLINQTFSGDSDISSSSSSSSSSDDTVVITESSSSSSSSSVSSSSSSSSSSESSSSLSSSSSSSSQDDQNTTIENNQMSTELISLNDGLGVFRIVECGAEAQIPSCKAGVNINLSVSAWGNLTVGQQYLITGDINSDGGGFTVSIDSITAL